MKKYDTLDRLVLILQKRLLTLNKLAKESPCNSIRLELADQASGFELAVKIVRSYNAKVKLTEAGKSKRGVELLSNEEIADMFVTMSLEDIESFLEKLKDPPPSEYIKLYYYRSIKRLKAWLHLKVM